MKRALNFIPVALAMSLCGGLMIGCGKEAVGTVVQADQTAVKDPDAKAKLLLDELAKVPADEKQSWVQQNDFALMVFANVKDQTLLSRYQQEIVPLKGN